MSKEELRPCIVKKITYPKRSSMNQCEILEPKIKKYSGYFHTWEQLQTLKRETFSGAMLGQISAVYGIVEYEDGTIHEVAPECITFTDRKEC